MKRVALFLAFLWSGIIGASAQVDRCDVNGDGEVDISDVTYVVDHILGRGHASTPSEEAGEAIDLDLPSGNKWASCNVGATKPEEYGGYYAWGETEEKSVYNNVSYKYADGVDSDGNGWYDGDCTYQSLGADISGTKYDVAHLKWGGKWCMPTRDDFMELFDNCTYEWTTLNGVEGRRFTSKHTDNSIFLPAAGCRRNDNLIEAGEEGDYWSSTKFEYFSGCGCGLYFDSVNAYWTDLDFRSGRSVRPVIKK